MKKVLKKSCKKFNNKLKTVCLVDKVLVIYMFVLLIYLAVCMLGGCKNNENNVNVIVRTAASAIFGYFISSNFMPQKKNTDMPSGAITNTAQTELSPSNPVKQIGFQTDAGEKDLTYGSIKINETQTERCSNKLQIILVSCIGFVSLIILITSRNFTESDPELTATVSHLRDFVSASIGFLVSCGKEK